MTIREYLCIEDYYEFENGYNRTYLLRAGSKYKSSFINENFIEADNGYTISASYFVGDYLQLIKVNKSKLNNQEIKELL